MSTLAQHRIPSPAPITDAMTYNAVGMSAAQMVGERVVTSYEIPDSDRSDTLLLTASGTVFCLSCDPRIADDDVTRIPDQWEVVLYDASDTEAGRAIKDLAPGHWM